MVFARYARRRHRSSFYSMTFSVLIQIFVKKNPVTFPASTTLFKPAVLLLVVPVLVANGLLRLEKKKMNTSTTNLAQKQDQIAFQPKSLFVPLLLRLVAADEQAYLCVLLLTRFLFTAIPEVLTVVRFSSFPFLVILVILLPALVNHQGTAATKVRAGEAATKFLRGVRTHRNLLAIY